MCVYTIVYISVCCVVKLPAHCLMCEKNTTHFWIFILTFKHNCLRERQSNINYISNNIVNIN